MPETIKRFYITFGSDDIFPFKNTFIVIEANNEDEVQQVYRILYPDKNNSNCLNYSFLYTHEEWFENIYYHYKQPAVIIPYKLVKSLIAYRQN